MPPNRVPMVSTGRPSAQAASEAQRHRDQEGWPVRPIAAHGEDDADHGGGDRDRRGVRGGQCGGQRRELGHDRPWLAAGQRQAQQLLELAGEDDHRDAGGEARRSPDTGCT